jgi:fatty acid desaturase
VREPRVSLLAAPQDTIPPPRGLRERIPRLLIRALAVYTAIGVPFIVAVIWVGSRVPRDRALILMAAGLVVLWVFLGGLLTLRYRDRFQSGSLRLPVS